jgi:glycosyltransferase involved in cell wall biosynthesis
MINYTFIIPHRNIPLLLERCLWSIPQRNDIQIIVIDDKSDTNLCELQNIITKTQYRVDYIRSSNNLGGGNARNLGLEKAKGKWIIFADADDFFNYCITDILDQYKDSLADIIYFKGNSVDTDTYITTYRADHLNKWIDLHKKHPNKSNLYLRYYFGEPWCKIIRKSLIDQYKIRFDETPIHNDTTFSYLIGFHAKTIAVDDRALYCVTTRKNSVSVSINPQKELIRIDVFSRAESFFRQNKIPLSMSWHYSQAISFLLRGDIKSFKKAILIMKKNSSFTRYSILLFFKEFLLHIIQLHK